MIKTKPTPVKEVSNPKPALVPATADPYVSSLIDESVAEALKTLNKRIDEQPVVSAVVAEAAEKIKTFKEDLSKALDEAGNTPVTETPNTDSMWANFANKRNTPGDPNQPNPAKDQIFKRSDYRGIAYSAKLLDKVNAATITDYGSAEIYHKVKDVERKNGYYPYSMSRRDSVGIANMAIFNPETYKNALDSVFYLTTTPGNVAYDELNIMPEVINKIRQYERIYGTGEVLTEEGRQTMIDSILMSNITEVATHRYGLEYAKNYSSEMNISDAEAEHIHALVRTLELHRKFSEINKEVFTSPVNIRDHYTSLSDPIHSYSTSKQYEAQQHYRKLKVIHELLELMIPMDVSTGVIHIHNEYERDDYGPLRVASARLRRAATVYVEGGSLADLLVAIGSYTLTVRKKYNALIDRVNATFLYLSNNGLLFSEVFEDMPGIHKRRFSMSSGPFNSNWPDGGF